MVPCPCNAPLGHGLCPHRCVRVFFFRGVVNDGKHRRRSPSLPVGMISVNRTQPVSGMTETVIRPGLRPDFVSNTNIQGDNPPSYTDVPPLYFFPKIPLPFKRQSDFDLYRRNLWCLPFLLFCYDGDGCDGGKIDEMFMTLGTERCPVQISV